MSRRFYFLAAVLAVCASPLAQASQDVATDVHVGYEYSTKVLANAGKECKAVRRTIEQADGSSFVDCLSKNGKDNIRYRITPKTTSVPTVGLVSRKLVEKADKDSDQSREDTINQHAKAIIQDYRYECLKVVTVTAQEDSSLLAVCKPEYGRKPIAYRLVETPGAHLRTRVIPVQ